MLKLQVVPLLWPLTPKMFFPNSILWALQDHTECSAALTCMTEELFMSTVYNLQYTITVLKKSWRAAVPILPRSKPKQIFKHKVKTSHSFLFSTSMSLTFHTYRHFIKFILSNILSTIRFLFPWHKPAGLDFASEHWHVTFKSGWKILFMFVEKKKTWMVLVAFNVCSMARKYHWRCFL